MNLAKVCELLSDLSSGQSGIDVLWLYGSRARGDQSMQSDYDLALAISGEDEPASVLERFQSQVQELLQRDVSVVDINRVPVTLAINVIEDGLVVFCASDLRLHAEESRIWSAWENVAFEAKRFPNEL